MVSTNYLELRLLSGQQGSAQVYVNAALQALDAQLDLTRVLTIDDDFVGALRWSTTSSGSGASSLNSSYTGEANAVGVLSLATGTTTSGYAQVHSASAALIRLGGGELRLRTRFRVEDLSDGTDTYTLRAGLGDSAVAGEPTDGCYLRYTHGTNSGKFQCVTRSNGTETATDSGLTVAADTWYTLDLVIDETAATVTFLINGEEVAANTTNVPTSAGRETGVQVSILKSAGTNSRTLNVDFLGLRVEFTTERT